MPPRESRKNADGPQRQHRQKRDGPAQGADIDPLLAGDRGEPVDEREMHCPDGRGDDSPSRVTK